MQKMMQSLGAEFSREQIEKRNTIELTKSHKYESAGSASDASHERSILVNPIPAFFLGLILTVPFLPLLGAASLARGNVKRKTPYSISIINCEYQNLRRSVLIYF
jgi:hypothetical protein